MRRLRDVLVVEGSCSLNLLAMDSEKKREQHNCVKAAEHGKAQ